MFDNVALDVFIGLVFIFLLYSLLATILQELIARAFNLRARMLQKSLRRMLEDGSKKEYNGNADGWTRIWTRLTIFSFLYDIAVAIGRFFVPFREKESLIKKFYDHPSIKYLAEDNSASKPSYLTAQSFSQTIIQLLRGEQYDGRSENESELIRTSLLTNTLSIKGETLKQLKHLFYDARQDSLTFKIKLENWFNEMQDRTTGWYKKQNQVILILVGFWIAFLFNVDAISIYTILSKDKNARENLVKMAVDSREKYQQIVLQINPGTGKEPSTDIVRLNQQTDSAVSKTYQLLSDDAEKANDILGLGKPWKDSCTVCKDSLKVWSDTKTDDCDNYNNIITSFTQEQQNSTTQVRTIIDSLIAVYKKADSTKKTEDILSLVQKNLKDSGEIANAKAVLSQLSKKLYLMQRCAYIKKQMDENCPKYSARQAGGWTTIFGWLITALAISLGAPFWFDLLNKFIQLRGTGPKPAAATNAVPATNNQDPLTAPDGQTIRG